MVYTSVIHTELTHLVWRQAAAEGARYSLFCIDKPSVVQFPSLWLFDKDLKKIIVVLVNHPELENRDEYVFLK